MSLIYIVKRSGPNIEPWRTPIKMSFLLTGSCVEVAVKPHLCHNVAVIILKCCGLMYQKLLTNQ